MNLNHIYAVRVRAENDFGVSDPSQPATSRLLTRSKSERQRSKSNRNFRFLADERRPEDQVEPISKYKRPPTSTYDDIGGEKSRVLIRHSSLPFSGSRPSLQVDGPDIQYFLEGQNARITMLLLGYPVPDIAWYHDVSSPLRLPSNSFGSSSAGQQDSRERFANQNLQRSPRLRVSLDRFGRRCGRRRVRNRR